jgi:hypothetical protein
MRHEKTSMRYLWSFYKFNTSILSKRLSLHIRFLVEPACAQIFTRRLLAASMGKPCQ